MKYNYLLSHKQTTEKCHLIKNWINLRIIECVKLEGSHKDPWLQLPESLKLNHMAKKEQHCNAPLELQQACAASISLGSLIQWLAGLPVKNPFLMSSLSFVWRSFVQFPCVLSMISRQRSASSSLLPAWGEVQTAMSPPRALLQAEQAKGPQPLLPSLALKASSAHHDSLVSFMYWDVQNCTQQLRWSHSSAEQGGTVTLALLAVLCPMLPRTGLSLLAARALLTHDQLATNPNSQTFPHGCACSLHKEKNYVRELSF